MILLHGIGKNKAITFKAVPEVIENGKVIDVTKNWKNRGYDSVAIGGKISIDSGDRAGEYYMVCLLHVDNTNRMYLHEVRTIKTDEMRSKTGTSVGKTNLQLPSANHPSILSLLNKMRNVNSDEAYNKKKFQLQDTENNYHSINEAANKHLLESYEERRLHFNCVAYRQRN